MSDPQFLTTPQGRRLAFCRRAGTGPGVVFLHGFRSDMGGTKAEALDTWAAARGRAFLRFDCGGHGASSGDFGGLGIGDWLADVLAVLDALTEGPQVLVGSSMGGWLALLAARARPERVAGLVGIAAAPDFTEDSLWAGMTEGERALMLTEGRIERASVYDPSPYVFTHTLVEQGRKHLVLRTPLSLPFPVRLLQGTEDTDVPPAVALRLLSHATGPDIRLTLVKGADHRFSDAACLALLARTLDEMSVDPKE
jgi:pimeloyl-ACP methyl ester carboxylesterase